MIKVASPLFILREQCKQNLFSVLEHLAALGFDGVEFISFFGHEASAIRAKLDELGLTALGNHVPYTFLDAAPEKVLNDHQLLGCHYLTVAELPEGNLSPAAYRLKEIADMAAERGIRLLYHNHASELSRQREGQVELEAIMAAIPPEVLALEPYLGWIEVGGGKPAEYLIRYSDRCPVIHLKDYYADGPIGQVQGNIPPRGDSSHGNFEFRPTGYGVVNIPALMPLCLACKPEWFVVDHDLAYDRDSFEDLKLSLDYVRSLLKVHHL